MNTETRNKEPRILKVRNSTDSNKLASTLISAYGEDNHQPIIIRVIGAAALNQAVKGVIIANTNFVRKGLVAVLLPSFKDLQEDMTAIQLTVKFDNI